MDPEPPWTASRNCSSAARARAVSAAMASAFDVSLASAREASVCTACNARAWLPASMPLASSRAVRKLSMLAALASTPAVLAFALVNVALVRMAVCSSWIAPDKWVAVVGNGVSPRRSSRDPILPVNALFWAVRSVWSWPTSVSKAVSFVCRARCFLADGRAQVVLSLDARASVRDGFGVRDGRCGRAEGLEPNLVDPFDDGGRVVAKVLLVPTKAFRALIASAFI